MTTVDWNSDRANWIYNYLWEFLCKRNKTQNFDYVVFFGEGSYKEFSSNFRRLWNIKKAPFRKLNYGFCYIVDPDVIEFLQIMGYFPISFNEIKKSMSAAGIFKLANTIDRQTIADSSSWE